MSGLGQSERADRLIREALAKEGSGAKVVQGCEGVLDAVRGHAFATCVWYGDAKEGSVSKDEILDGLPEALYQGHRAGRACQEKGLEAWLAQAEDLDGRVFHFLLIGRSEGEVLQSLKEALQVVEEDRPAAVGTARLDPVERFRKAKMELESLGGDAEGRRFREAVEDEHASAAIALAEHVLRTTT